MNSSNRTPVRPTIAFVTKSHDRPRDFVTKASVRLPIDQISSVAPSHVYEHLHL